jgi:hypothetical protein
MWSNLCELIEQMEPDAVRCEGDGDHGDRAEDGGQGRTQQYPQQVYQLDRGTHYISNSGSDENGAYSGGQAGDQTGKEWRMRDWYNRPWTCVLRYPDQKVALKIAQLGHRCRAE